MFTKRNLALLWDDLSRRGFFVWPRQLAISSSPLDRRCRQRGITPLSRRLTSRKGGNTLNPEDSFWKGPGPGMAKSSKLVAAKRGRVLLVRRRRDRIWMFPGGRRRGSETEKDCLRREIREELPKLKMGRLRLWKEVKAKNRRSGRKMSDAIFFAKKASGSLAIGDKKEIDKATWRKPRGIRLTATSRYIRDKLFPKGS
jgi:8-oxo-dGTP diphosphatase